VQLLLGHTEALAVALGLVAAALAVKSFACERAGDQLDARPRMFADSSGFVTAAVACESVAPRQSGRSTPKIPLVCSRPYWRARENVN